MALKSTEINTYFGKCRCCLNYGYLKNMWEEHDWQGEKEVYVEMLVQCFALSWEHSEDSMEHDQICEACVLRLRDAYSFKKSILESQEKLLGQNNEEMEVSVKIERPDCSSQEGSDNEAAATSIYIDEPDDPDDSADPDYVVSEYLEDSDDPHGPNEPDVSNDMEYEQVEYLDIEDNKEALAIQQNPQTVNTSARRMKSKKPPPIPPKAKWPRKLPKSERYKTYKQYTEEDLRKCLEAVRNEELTAQEAAVKFNIPKKTIAAKTRVLKDPNDDQKGNTTTEKDKLDTIKTLPRKKTTVFRADKLKTQIIKKIKTKKIKVEELQPKDGVDKEKDSLAELLLNIKSERSDVIGIPVNADQVRTKYKAIVDAKFKNENKECEKNDVNEMNKHRDNIRNILECSNATMIKGFWGNGYSCCFCNVQKEIPSELKLHNLEAHNDIGNDVIKVKYVSDLVMRLDITNLKCKLCELSIDSLESFTEHLIKIHNKNIHKDIKNHIIPFKFESDSLQCIKCNKQYKYFKLLSEHMSEHYRNYECPLCERSFINKQSMQTHSYRHKSGVFKCSHCPKVFDTKPKRSVHERVTHTLSNKTRKCNFCDERFSTKDLVQNHESKIHGAEIPVFKCQACNKSYTSQSSLITHRKRFHLMLRPHKCSYCDMAFFSRIELRSHTVTHTKSRDFKCDMCNKSFGTRCSLNQHIRGHLDDRRFKCDSCERAFVHRTAFKVHMRNGQRKTTKTTTGKRTNSRKTVKRKIILKFKDNVRHILENSNATPLKGHWGIGYGCYYCQYQNASAAELKTHTLRSHSDVIDAIKAECSGSMNIKLDITGLQCSICDGKFEFLNEFIEHLNVIHFKEMYLDTINNIIPYKFDTEYLQCAICSRQFPYFKHLTEHMTEHYRNVFCDICGRGFINKMSLKTHIMRHDIGIFTCSYCSKVFDARVKMMSHERIVHVKESKIRKCGYCDERFKDHKDKTFHEASVHGVKMPSFECKACGKKYNSQRGLRCHTQSYHLMVKRHICDVCGKGFCYRNGLKMHEITHTGAREFQCGVCLKWYSTKKVLRAHMRIHENDRRFKCVICERAFVQKCAWMQHMRNKHAGEFDGI